MEKHNDKKIRSRSKERQDLWVLSVLGRKENGFFVDIGATNGVHNSNSYILEKEFGWKGICVEPNPLERSFPSLVKNRSCILENCCIYSRSGFVNFVPRGRKTETSGIYNEHHTDSFIYSLVKRGYKIISVPCITLLELLDRHNSPKVIDYMSIDVEESAWEVLRYFDFKKYLFLTMTVEHNCPKEKENEMPINRENRDNIRSLLKENGYTLKNELYFGEDWFVHNSIEEKGI